MTHALRERGLRGRVTLGVDHDDLPVARGRNTVGKAAERDGLARAGRADHQQRAAEARERHQHPAALDLQHGVAGDVTTELEDELTRCPGGEPGGAAGLALSPLTGDLGPPLVALAQLLDRPPAKRGDSQRDREAQRRREQPPCPDVRPRRLQRFAGLHEHPVPLAGPLGALHLKLDPRPPQPHPPGSCDCEHGEGERRPPGHPREPDPDKQRGRAEEHADGHRQHSEIWRRVGIAINLYGTLPRCRTAAFASRQSREPGCAGVQTVCGLGNASTRFGPDRVDLASRLDCVSFASGGSQRSTTRARLGRRSWTRAVPFYAARRCDERIAGVQPAMLVALLLYAYCDASGISRRSSASAMVGRRVSR